jgi:hypothetical protein
VIIARAELRERYRATCGNFVIVDNWLIALRAASADHLGLSRTKRAVVLTQPIAELGKMTTKPVRTRRIDGHRSHSASGRAAREIGRTDQVASGYPTIGIVSAEMSADRVSLTPRACFGSVDGFPGRAHRRASSSRTCPTSAVGSPGRPSGSPDTRTADL